MVRIVHLSDLHFGAELPEVVAALRDELNRDPPDLVAVSGDLTMRARRREFIAARGFLDSISAPVLAVPGNHDITPYALVERFTDPYGRWRRYIAAETEPVFQDATIGVVGLNTARRAGFYLNWARGRIDVERLERCAERLAALPPGLIRVVVAHHPFVAPRVAPEARTVGGAAAALATFARLGVRLVLSGHLHVGDIARPAVATGPMLVVLASTATSHRLRGEPNAFNDIHIDAEGEVSITARAWDGQAWAALAP